MKALKVILSLAAVTLAIGAIACAVTAYWDNLTELYACAKEKLVKRGNSCGVCADDDDGFSDFVDVE